MCFLSLASQVPSACPSPTTNLQWDPGNRRLALRGWRCSPSCRRHAREPVPAGVGKTTLALSAPPLDKLFFNVSPIYLRAVRESFTMLCALFSNSRSVVTLTALPSVVAAMGPTAEVCFIQTLLFLRREEVL